MPVQMDALEWTAIVLVYSLPLVSLKVCGVVVCVSGVLGSMLPSLDGFSLLFIAYMSNRPKMAETYERFAVTSTILRNRLR